MSEKKEEFSRQDLIGSVYGLTGFTKGQSEGAVKAVIAAIKQAVKNGKRVQIREFLTLEAKESPERQGRNPRTGEPITVPAHKRVSAKANFEVE